MTDEPLFKSTHDALTFAFNYAAHQSPKTPAMAYRNPGDAPIGSGKGLFGVDGATQAGFILADVDRLPVDQRSVIVAIYDRPDTSRASFLRERPSDRWVESINVLANLPEISGLHIDVKYIMLEHVVFKKRVDADLLNSRYSLARSTSFKKFSDLKNKIYKIEKTALSNLDNAFFEKKELVA